MGNAYISAGHMAWLIVVVVLVMVASGRFRFDLVAVAGLLAAGVSGLVPVTHLLSGFSSPALFTIACVLLLSEGITESRLFSGLGQALERRVRARGNQLLALATVTAVLSAFMNNVGALSLSLPTAKRMARRAHATVGSYTMPLAYAAIMGGTLTLAGSAPNIVVSSFRAKELGSAFGMLDFLPHGAAVLASGLALWTICRICGLELGREADAVDHSGISIDESPPDMFPRDLLSTPAKRTTLITVTLTLAAVTSGLLAPVVAFGLGALVLMSTGVLDPATAYSRLDLSVLVFLGSMLGLARMLQETGAIALLTDPLLPLVGSLPPFLLVAAVFMLSSLLGSILNNAAAAAIMAPMVLELGKGVTVDALLMAVAGGACLSMLLPTHQATVMAMSMGWFSPARFARTGVLLTAVAAAAASWIIVLVW